MPQSLACVYVHAVFSTKDRLPHLADQELRERTMAFIAEVIRKQDCAVVEVGGYVDHVHFLCRLSRTIALADLMKETKRVSSPLPEEPRTRLRMARRIRRLFRRSDSP